MSGRVLVAVGIAGSLGAMSRYWVDTLVRNRNLGMFPWGTFVVNISGAFALGLLFTLTTERFGMAPWLRSGLTIGFLGAYTTFSTLMFDTYRLGAGREYALAGANMLGSCAAGLVAVYLGVQLARVF